MPALTATSVRKPVADDHLNMTSIHGGPHDGTVLTVLKLGIGGAGNPRVVVAKRTPGGVWTHSVFGLGAEDHTRPIIVYDSGVDSVYVFASSGRSDPGTVYMKGAHINDLTNNFTFPPGFGRVFIKSEIDSKVNNPTSTKQSLNPSTGLLVQWGDRNSRYYLHNYLVSSNHAPLAAPDTVAPQGEGALLIDVTINDSDPDGTINKTTVSIVEAPINGTATVDALTGIVTYLPNPGFPGNDRFRYTVRDDKNVSAPAATVTITGTLASTSPIASDNAGATDEDMPVALNVLANDSDADGILDPSTVIVVSGPSQGVTTVDTVSWEITYIPAANFFGADSFTYTVKDNDGVSSNIAAVTISGSSINDSPIAFDDAARLAKDTAMALQVLNNDVDVDGVINPASVAIVSGPNNGSTSIDVTTGAITFTPDFGFIGQSIFTYTVQDNDGVPRIRRP